jgi:phosphoglycerate dehydrogenase-like enzyme
MQRLSLAIVIGSFTIWSNVGLPPTALDLLRQNLGNYRLVFANQTHASNLVAGGPDALLAEADIAFGQPDPKQIIDSPKVKWVQLSTAGYTRYDTAEFRAAMNERGGVFTNSSSVFAEPCAEHLLGMILSLARRLPQALDSQRDGGLWPIAKIRSESRLLQGQTALIYSMGAIARRLIELLTPLGMKLTGVRQNVRGDEPISTVTPAQADAILPTADHVIDILPASVATTDFFNADRFARMKKGAIFYNIGRGSTVDQKALLDALESGRVGAAYLDVVTPEPLPPEHPLWKAKNCFITPHTAGGHSNESERMVGHFLDNLRRFEAGEKLKDMVV